MIEVLAVVLLTLVVRGLVAATLPDLAWWVMQFVGFALGGGVIALATWLLTIKWQRRKVKAETQTAEASATDSLAAVIESIGHRLAAAETRNAECERDNRALRDRVNRIEEESERIRVALAMALAGKRLEHWQGLRELFDIIPVPLVITSPINEGEFLHANKAFCALLDRDLSEIIRLGWVGLIHPDDLADTKAVEASAHDTPVRGHVNRYRRRDGSYVRVRWYTAAYSAGGTIAYVRHERRVPHAAA